MPRTVDQLSSAGLLRVLVNGLPPGPDGLTHPALINYGHYTAMQVRGGRARGIDLHLDRIARTHRDLFASDIDLDLVREHMRTAVLDLPDCYLRTVLFESEPGHPDVMTVQRPPVEVSTEPVALLPVDYQHPFAHMKHMGTFSKIYHSVVAQRNGFDDALHTTGDGWISETTGANIGFLDGSRVVWPAQPALQGVTKSLLEDALKREGIETVTEPINVRDVSELSAAFLSNSVGVAPVGRIGARDLGDPGPVVELLSGLYESTPWDDV